MIAIDKYLLLKPTTRMIIEWPILIAFGILGGLLTPWRIPFFPISNVAGIIVFVAAMSLHMKGHAVHKQADQNAEKIEDLVTTGMFAHVRHPMYSSLILMVVGMTVATGVAIMILPALIVSLLTVLTALKEEEFLIKRFGDEYREYMARVPHRFIPRIF
ncbi:MAG: isoprenylcysteine carboxylmethyltransferase family protein [candidate division WOR-3 bacterium]|nr:MAG: isoprenylcysteine carboxylmethyltransferase family protein [candidate division WOR-3 bacterium]